MTGIRTQVLTIVTPSALPTELTHYISHSVLPTELSHYTYSDLTLMIAFDRSVTEASQHSTPEMECTTAAASPQHFYQDKYPVYWPVRGPTVPTHPILEPALPINYNKMMPGLLMPVPGLGPRATGLNDIDMERYQPLLDDMGNAR